MKESQVLKTISLRLDMGREPLAVIKLVVTLLSALQGAMREVLFRIQSREGKMRVNREKGAVLLSVSMISVLLLQTVCCAFAGGPVTQDMLIPIFPNAEEMFGALDVGDIDIVDWPLPKYWIYQWSQRPDITMDGYAPLDNFQIDMNNQWWPTGPNDPTHQSPGPWNTYFDPNRTRDLAAWHFRRAIAHLADRWKYVNDIQYLNGMGYECLTEMPIPALEGYTDYSTLTNATAVADAGPGGYTYPYNRAAAISELELGHFRDWDADGFREWKDPDTGIVEELPNMKFWIRLDDLVWRQIGEHLYTEMLRVGIPQALDSGRPGLEKVLTDISACLNAVMVAHNWNFFAGCGWMLRPDIEFVYDLYHSSQYPLGRNYPGFKNHYFDPFAEKLKCPESMGELGHTAVEAQWMKAKYVPVIHLWTSKAVKAYRTGWQDMVNMAGYGIDNQYSFLLMNWTNGPGTWRNGPPNTIVWGMSGSPSDLHIITSPGTWPEPLLPDLMAKREREAGVLNLMYDRLISRDPYNLAQDVGWLATSWNLTFNYPGWGDKAVVEFTVRTDAKFHDGSPVKPADVAFSILMIRDAGLGIAWNYPCIAEVAAVEIENGTVRVFFNVRSIWALHWAGFLPVVNKDMWFDAVGVPGVYIPQYDRLSQGFTGADYIGWIPDDTNGIYTGGTFANVVAVRDYHPWEDTRAGDPARIDIKEDGGGPWSFVSYLPNQRVNLTAFADIYDNVTWRGRFLDVRDFVYQSFHALGNVNYEGGYGGSHGWYETDRIIDLNDLMLIVTSMPSSSTGPWGPGQMQYNPDADINSDGKVNIIDLATAGTNYNKDMG